jgi:hypothetical protein
MKKFLIFTLILWVGALVGFRQWRPQVGLPLPILPRLGNYPSLMSQATLVNGKLRMGSSFEKAQNRIRVLDEIFLSKNDNDPRLDTDFKDLTPEDKESFVQKYTQLSPEARNERGTIIFILGRAITSSSDLNFLRQVLEEPRCLNMLHCSQPADADTREDDHETSMQRITLAYPQIVALKALAAFVVDHPSSSLAPQAYQNLKGASQSPDIVVRSLANEILSQMGSLNSL